MNIKVMLLILAQLFIIGSASMELMNCDEKCIRCAARCLDLKMYAYGKDILRSLDDEEGRQFVLNCLAHCGLAN